MVSISVPEITVTLQWDHLNECWRDKETQAKVTGVQRWVLSQADAPSQPSTDHQSITLAFTPDQVRDMVNRAIDDRIAKPGMYFAPQDDVLITYVFHRVLIEHIQVFGARLNKLERPWYKRWLSR